MGAPFKLGQAVRQIVKPIEGLVAQVVFDDKADKFRVRVQEPSGDERWFWQDEVEGVVAEAAEVAQ